MRHQGKIQGLGILVLGLVLVVLALPPAVWPKEVNIFDELEKIKILFELAHLKMESDELSKQGRYEEAIPLAQQALALARQQFGENHPSTATSYNNLALLYEATGRYAAAEPLYQRALEINRKALGEDHPDTATSYDNLAYLYLAQGRLQEAERLFR